VPDLIVTDYKMPGMNGASFIRRLRAEPVLADVPVIVITVFEERSFRLRALDAGATDFLLSPVDHREFVTRARNLLKLRKQQLLLAHRAERLERKLDRSERSFQELVRDSSERLAQVIDAVPAMISATDQHGRFLFVNAYQAQLIGLEPADAAGRDVADVLGAEYGERNRAFDQLILQGNHSIHSFEEEVADRCGQRRVFLTTKSPLKNAANQTIGVVTSSLDISERKTAERHLQHMAHHDSLTGLPNRVLLSEHARQEIARARRGDRRFAVHWIDLDGFKSVNDVMGHATGDDFLVEVSKRLLTLKRHNDYMVARLGGDEFAVLQTDLADNEAAAALADQIVSILREPLLLTGKRVALGASVGTAIHPADGDNVEDLLRHADLAMYKAKGDGGDRHQFYAADMKRRACQAAELDAELRLAIERDEFMLHYQPQVQLNSGEIVGAEALVRWRKPDGTVLSPAGFLARAEENGTIIPISAFVLRAACQQAAAWRRRGFPLRMSVNLSPIQFRGPGLPTFVAHVLSETKLDPHLLELELTENILMHDIDHVVGQLQQLSDLGVVISIDDFGTGFSSLNYVKRLPVDRLKIDQSFIRDVTSDPNDRAIVSAIVNLAHSLRMEVVAEGVETAEQLECVRAAGCDTVQGYYFGKPMGAAQFEIFMARDLQMAAAANG
jgi:diguanylate cyclase (GGDEF)-like protein/PAS domain S-box-containing protein